VAHLTIPPETNPKCSFRKEWEKCIEEEVIVFVLLSVRMDETATTRDTSSPRIGTIPGADDLEDLRSNLVSVHCQSEPHDSCALRACRAPSDPDHHRQWRGRLSLAVLYIKTPGAPDSNLGSTPTTQSLSIALNHLYFTGGLPPEFIKRSSSPTNPKLRKVSG
jgi:hypothetical protein